MPGHRQLRANKEDPHAIPLNANVDAMDHVRASEPTVLSAGCAAAEDFDATISEIAECVGVGRITFHRHFPELTLAPAAPRRTVNAGSR